MTDLPPLRDVIAAHGLQARKSLGQHFLFDLNLTRRIARSVENLSDGTTIEIGPGPGGLTRALLQFGGSVIAIEKDERCLACLAELEKAYPGRLEVLAGDALTIEARKLGVSPRRIVANLPYNVASPLLVGWLREIAISPRAFDSLTLMFQKEVAERIRAAPGNKTYGRLSVISQWLTRPEQLFDVPAAAFTPPPKVTSSVLRLTPRPGPLAEARFATLERVTGAAFGKRRKMLRQSLKSLGVDTAALLGTAGIDGERRAEEIDVAGFCALARALDAA